MSSDLAVVKKFTNLVHAEVFRAMLEASGIDAIVVKDDAGGMAPALQIFAGVQLVVRAEDLEIAREILEATPVESTDLDESDD